MLSDSVLVPCLFFLLSQCELLSLLSFSYLRKPPGWFASVKSEKTCLF